MWRRPCRPGVVGIPSLLLALCTGTETASFSYGGLGNVVNYAAAAGSSCRLSGAAASSLVDPSHRRNFLWCWGNISGPAAGTMERTCRHLGTSSLPSLPSRSGLWVMVDSGGSSGYSRDGFALTTAQREMAAPVPKNILQRISRIITSNRLPAAAAPPPPSQRTRPLAPAHLSLLSSDPIKRFSGSSKPINKTTLFRSNRSPGSHATFAEAANVASSSLGGRLVSELRSRTFLTVGEHQHQQQLGGLDRGLQELTAAIARVETKLSLDSSEAGQLRGALRTLRSESEVYLREKASAVARMEAACRECDIMRRRVVDLEAELDRLSGRLRRAEANHEKTERVHSVRAKQLAKGVGREKGKFSRGMKATETRRGSEGAAAAASREVDRGYRERLRARSDELASTQLQLETLKSNRDSQIQQGQEARKSKSVTTEVARLKAQLKRAGEGIEQEMAEMEKLLLSMSNAVSAVDVQLTKSAARAPSREALKQAQGEFRRDHRRVRLLLTNQRQRYDTVLSVVEEEAQRLKSKTVELISLRAELVESATKQNHLKSNVSVLGNWVSVLDHDLWKTRAALSQEQGLRHEAHAALLKSERQQEIEIKRLRNELKATHDMATSIRKMHEVTVKQRKDWRKVVEDEQTARAEAADRAKASQAALKDAVMGHERAAEQREGEIAELKSQVVNTSRSLALSEAERASETKRLQAKIDELNQELLRLGAQAEDGKSLAARALTTVSARAFRSVSQVSQSLAPHGLLSKLGGTTSTRFHRSNENSAGAGAPTTLNGSDGGGGMSDTDAAAGDAAQSAPNGARGPTPPHDSAKAVLRAGKGFDRRAVAASSSSAAPRVAEQAVKGVLDRMFPKREQSVTDGGLGMPASTAKQQGGQSPGRQSGNGVVNGRAGTKERPPARRQKGTSSADASPTPSGKRENIGVTGTNRSIMSVLGRLGRPTRGSGSSKSPTSAAATGEKGEVASGATAEIQGKDSNGFGKDRSGKKANRSSVSEGPVPAAATAPRPKAGLRPVESTTGVFAKFRGEKSFKRSDLSGTPTTTNIPDHHDHGGRRRTRPSAATEGKRHRLDPDFGEAGKGGKVMSKTRVPWAKLVAGRVGREEQNGITVKAGGHVDREGGNVASTSTKVPTAGVSPTGFSRFLGGFGKGRGRLGTGGNAQEALDEIGLGA